MIRTSFPHCEVDVPVIALGGVTVEGAQSKEGGTPRRSPRGLERHGAKSDFDVLWEILQTVTPLDTQRLQPFDGAAWEQYEAVINERDEVRAQMNAARNCVPVTISLLVPVVFLVAVVCLRAKLSFDLPGFYDETLVRPFLSDILRTIS